MRILKYIFILKTKYNFINQMIKKIYNNIIIII